MPGHAAGVDRGQNFRRRESSAVTLPVLSGHDTANGSEPRRGPQSRLFASRHRTRRRDRASLDGTRIPVPGDRDPPPTRARGSYPCRQVSYRFQLLVISTGESGHHPLRIRSCLPASSASVKLAGRGRHTTRGRSSNLASPLESLAGTEEAGTANAICCE